MKNEKRLFLLMFGIAIAISIIVYLTTREAYKSPPKEGVVIDNPNPPEAKPVQ